MVFGDLSYAQEESRGRTTTPGRETVPGRDFEGRGSRTWQKPATRSHHQDESRSRPNRPEHRPTGPVQSFPSASGERIFLIVADVEDNDGLLQQVLSQNPDATHFIGGGDYTERGDGTMLRRVLRPLRESHIARDNIALAPGNGDEWPFWRFRDSLLKERQDVPSYDHVGRLRRPGLYQDEMTIADHLYFLENMNPTDPRAGRLLGESLYDDPLTFAQMSEALQEAGHFDARWRSNEYNEMPFDFNGGGIFVSHFPLMEASPLVRRRWGVSIHYRSVLSRLGITARRLIGEPTTNNQRKRDEKPPSNARIVINGHLHVPSIVYDQALDTWFINPGTLQDGLPTKGFADPKRIEKYNDTNHVKKHRTYVRLHEKTETIQLMDAETGLELVRVHMPTRTVFFGENPIGEALKFAHQSGLDLGKTKVVAENSHGHCAVMLSRARTLAIEMMTREEFDEIYSGTSLSGTGSNLSTVPLGF